MALNFLTLTTQLGALGGCLKDLYAFQNGTWLTDLQNVLAQNPSANNYVPTQDFLAQLSSLNGLNGPLVTNLSSQLSVLQSTAQQIIQAAVQADSPPSFNVDLTAAVLEALRQFKLQGQTVKRCTVAATETAAPGVTNTGNGQVVLSTKRADGLIQENLYAESTLMTCTADAETGGTATAGNETFSWVGTQAAVNGFLDPNWPQGSGANQQFSVVSALYNNSNGNVLQNGDFEDWTGNVPNNWSILAGAGQVFKSTGQFYTGSACLEIVGGAGNVAIAQQFDSTSGTSYAIPPQTQFAFGFWVFLNKVPAAGTLEVALVDQNGTTTKDTQGVDNVCTFDLPTIAAGEPLSTSPTSLPFPTSLWTACSCVFRSGEVLPTTFFVRFRLTTPLSALTTMWIDQTAMGIMTQMYDGGPSIMMFDGSTHFIAGGPYAQAGGPPDQFKLVTTNDRGGASSLATWQTLFLRLLTQTPLVLWPSASSGNTIPDSRIAG